MYQIIDDKEEQKKYNEVVNKITPQSLGLKPTTDFAQYAHQVIIDEDPERVKGWIDKGAIGVMEAGKRYAEDFNGTYNNVISKEQETEEFYKRHPILKKYGEWTAKNRANAQKADKELDERLKNGTATKTDKLIAGLNESGKKSYEAQLQFAQLQMDMQMPHKDDSNYRYKPVSVDRAGRVIFQETDLRKKIDFSEALADSIGKGKALPLVSGWIEGADKKKYRDIAERIRNNEAIRQDELDYVNRYNDRLKEEYVRGYTIGGKIGENIAPSLIAFGSEIALGVGALRALGWAGKGKALGTLAGANLLKTGKIGKGVAKGVAFVTGTVAEAGMSAGVTTAINPARMYATYQERRLNDEMKITDRGSVIFREAEETPAKAFFKSLGQVYISYFTEGLGGLIGEPLKQGNKIVRGVGAEQFAKVLKANPAIEKVIKKTAPVFAKAYEKLNKLPVKGKSVDWLKSQVKFDGFIEELGEEVLEDVLNLAIGTNNEERSLENYVSKIVKTPEEWAVLSGVIALQGATISVAGNTLADVMQKNGASFENIVQVSQNSTEAEKIELIDEAIKRGDLNIPENALLENLEIQKEEVEQKAYEKLLNGKVDESQAMAISKLFGQFFKQYGSKSKEAFDKWFNKFEVRYNIPSEQNSQMKQSFQSAEVAGANNGEESEAQKEWQEKGTESPYFKRWFGHSKVVDENGKPLIVYHGTPNSFDSFSYDKIGTNGTVEGVGFYFADDADTAKGYIKRNGEVKECYLSIKKPLEHDSHFLSFDDIKNIIKKAAELQSEEYEEDIKDSFISNYADTYSMDIEDAIEETAYMIYSEDKNDTDMLGEIAYSANSEFANRATTLVTGYDGVIVNGYGNLGKGGGNFYIPFNPEQIKSVNNQGTFDAENPNIYFQSAYHGSPHRFDEFSTDNIGTGEGAQAHGWGLYFAEDKDVSEQYRTNLIRGGTFGELLKDIKIGSYNLGQALNRIGFNSYDMSSLLSYTMSGFQEENKDKIINKLNEFIEMWKNLPQATEWQKETSQKYKKLISLIEKNKLQNTKTGQLFEVDIPENDVLLDENTLLDEQPEKVQKAIKKLFYDNIWIENFIENHSTENPTGRTLYKALTNEYTPEEASKLLNEYGIKGISYNGGQDGRCYVIFDDKAISVLKTYYQEVNNSENEKMIAGYTYPEVLEKLTEIYERLGSEEKLSKAEQEKLITKAHILEDAFEVAENPEKFSNEERQHEIMLNAYYIMNNQEIPKKYVDADKISQRTYNDLKEIHEKKKAEAEATYYGYFSESKNKNIITIMANHNSSTALHELGHLFLNGLNELANVDENARVQLEAVNKWLGFSGEYTIAQQEKFARSFEAYLYKGKAPNNNLRQVFENFKEWLKSVYSHITELVDRGADISAEVTEMFDKMFANDEYYQERKQANELLKKVKNISRKEKMSKIPVRDDSKLDEVEKRHKNVAYSIVSVATGKSVKYLKTIFETSSGRQSFGKKRESIEMLLDKVDDKITVSGGLRHEWKEFYTDTGVSYENDEVDGDYKLFEQALDTIINKAYRNPAKMIETEADERAEYYAKAVDEADRQYKVLIRSFEKDNRNIALSAIYEWLSGLDSQIRQDYEDKFIFDSAMIERRENEDKFEKAKRQILSRALELENRYSISSNEKYKEVVKEVMKNLNFLQPSDKARLTANILDVPSVDFLMSSIDNILDIAKTMEDVNYRRKLEREIHKELQGTKNIKKNGRSVGKYDYKSNKIFEELRQLDRLSPEKANELRLEISKFATAEDNGLTHKDKLINKFLSYKAGGRTFADTELMKELYDEILRIKLIGKAAKSELDLLEKLDESKDIEELISIVQTKKDAKFLVKGYISGLGNLESTLNAIFNNDIKEKYGSEILYDETQAQAWQYKVKADFENEVAKIYGLPVWCWDKKVLEYLGEKHIYPEIRRKYDEKGEVIKTRNIDRTLTKMDIIQAYIWSKNEVLEKRLINQFGEDTLNSMFDELSLEDVKMAELMMRTAQSFYPLVNKAFIEKYGLDLPKVSCYFPSTPERGSEVDLYNEYSSKSLGNSFTKARAMSETQAMDFHNPVATLYSHIDGVAKFAFMSKNLDRANLRFKDLDLKRVIINKYGEDAYRTLEQILINITYKKEAPVFNGVNKIIDNMVANWIGANVSVKPIVGLKQLLSANNYAVDMPYMTWQKGFLKALANPKATIDYMMNIPYIKARYSGNMSNEFLKQTIENSAFAMSKKFKDSMSIFIKMGDIGAIIFGGKPYIDYLIKEKGLSEEQAIKQFILSTNRSQQSSAVSSLSNFQVAMTRNPMGKLFIAFKNSPQQYVRMCGDAIVSVANGDMSKKECAKMIFQYAYLQPFLYAAATSGSLFRFLFTGDDDDLLKDLKMSVFNLNANAVPLLGDIYLYAMNKLAYKEQVVPQTTPLLGDIENEINRLSKEDIKLKDYLEAIGYLGMHVGFGLNSKAIGSIGSSVGDFAEGNIAKGSMKALGYTDKRAKNITKK